MHFFQPFIAALLLFLPIASGASIPDEIITTGDSIKLSNLQRVVVTGNLSILEEDEFDLESEARNSVARPTRFATFNDQANINRFAAANIANTGARITYTQGNNNNGQNMFNVHATQATVRVTATSYAARLGSSAYNNGCPPGWNAMLAQVGGNVNRVHRGHLVPQRLGGSGLDVRNIVAMYGRVNSRHLAIWERMVNAAFDNNLVPQPECIEYRCIAYYGAAGRDSPDAVRTTAWLIRPGQPNRVWFDVTIPNQPNLAGTAAHIHIDDTANMFPSLNNRGRP